MQINCSTVLNNRHHMSEARTKEAAKWRPLGTRIAHSISTKQDRQPPPPSWCPCNTSMPIFQCFEEQGRGSQEAYLLGCGCRWPQHYYTSLSLNSSCSGRIVGILASDSTSMGWSTHRHSSDMFTTPNTAMASSVVLICCAVACRIQKVASSVSYLVEWN